MALKDLKITKKEAKEVNKSIGLADSDQERYPYGLRLDLNNDTLDKLGIDKLPAVGAVITFEAKAKVVGSRQSATEGSENRSIELQITHLDLEGDDKKPGTSGITRASSGAASNVAKKLASM